MAANSKKRVWAQRIVLFLMVALAFLMVSLIYFGFANYDDSTGISYPAYVIALYWLLVLGIPVAVLAVIYILLRRRSKKEVQKSK